MNKKTVLLVEDNDDSREMMKFFLERRGFHVIEASDGEQGVLLSKSESPDLIFMDLSMPVIDGIEATKLIRSNKKTSNIPVVVMSGHCDQPDLMKRVLEAGAAACLNKPVDIPTIETLLKRLIY